MASAYHVAYCLDKGCIPHIGAALASIFHNNRGIGLTAHLLVDFDAPEFTIALERIATAFGTNIVLYHLNSEHRQHLRGLQQLPWLSLGAYYRLLLPNYLPADVDRVLYLDTDTLVDGSLAELFAADLGGHVLAAVPDRQQAQHIPRLPLKGPYFNSGVLLMDLEHWRSDSLGEKALKIARERADIQHMDQDALNLLFDGAFLPLDEKWNAFVVQGRRLADDARILHFASWPKPWHAWYAHPLKSLYWNYLALTPWREAKPQMPATIDQALAYARLLRKEGNFNLAMEWYEAAIDGLMRERPGGQPA